MSPLGAAIGGLLGALGRIIQRYEKRDDAYKDWYRGLYENAGSETERMLTAGRSFAQETLGQPEAELDAVRGKLDAAGGEGYYAERNQGIAEQIASYGGELGEALAEANRAIGAGRAAMENLADNYTQEALSAVLTGSETTLQWSDDNAQRLQELGTLYQEATADYEAGNTEAGALVETYVEEARALAEAQYNSSEAALGVAEAEKDLITSINENTAALRGWRGSYDVSQALTKGRAVMEEGTQTPGGLVGGIYLQVKNPPSVRKKAGKQAVGIDYVPYDNFPALLHQGERVQTAAEARSQQRVPAITITGNSFSIREDADVDRVASELLKAGIIHADLFYQRRDRPDPAGDTGGIFLGRGTNHGDHQHLPAGRRLPARRTKPVFRRGAGVSAAGTELPLDGARGGSQSPALSGHFDRLGRCRGTGAVHCLRYGDQHPGLPGVRGMAGAGRDGRRIRLFMAAGVHGSGGAGGGRSGRYGIRNRQRFPSGGKQRRQAVLYHRPGRYALSHLPAVLREVLGRLLQRPGPVQRDSKPASHLPGHHHHHSAGVRTAGRVTWNCI